MPIIDLGSPTYVKAKPKFKLVSDTASNIDTEDRLCIGEPYLLTDSSLSKDDNDEETQLDQFSCLMLDREALITYCGPDIIKQWDDAARLITASASNLPGINIDHLFVKHLGIIMRDTEDPSIAIEEEDNTPDRVAAQQAILQAYGNLMAAITLGVAKKLFKTPGYEDIATQIDYMAHILKRRHFPCFGSTENAWFNNLTIHTSTEIQDLTRDRSNFNGAVPMPALFVRGSGRVYMSRFAKVFEAKQYSVAFIGGAEQVVVSESPEGEKERTIVCGRCEENVFKHYAQYDPMNQLRDRLAQEMKPEESNIT